MKLRSVVAGAFALVSMVATAGAQSLNGAGATFPNPIYSKWFYEFSQQKGGLKINYQPIGSGGGIRQVSDGTVDFGATDGPMTDDQMRTARVKTLHIPTVLGAVVPVYNLKGVSKDLNFSGDVLAAIYMGEIKTWNDPRIAKDNPGVALPNDPIVAVYRSDGSGTTYIFTDYLGKVSPDWQSKVGKATSVKWPTGIGQKGNEGVAGMVRQTPNSIGYVELVYALQNKMQFGAVKNAAGKFVKASTEGVTSAGANVKNGPADYRVSITNAPGAATYPISSYTWLLIPAQSADPAKGKILVEFLTWMLDHGEAEAPSLSYAALPTSVQNSVRQTIKQIH
ncbi:MAG: phosphate ABC transporter substrate-binding protein PstS [Janthinobacterium lividum]